MGQYITLTTGDFNFQQIVSIALYVGILCIPLFVLFIIKFNLKKLNNKDDKSIDEKETILYSDKSLVDMAASYVAFLGGKANIEQIETNNTHIILTLKDSKNICDKQLKAIGATQIIKINNKTIQIVVGNKAEFIVYEIKKILE